MSFRRLLAVVVTLGPIAAVTVAVASAPPSTAGLPSFEIRSGDTPVRLTPAEFGVTRTDSGLAVDDRRLSEAVDRLARTFDVKPRRDRYELVDKKRVLLKGGHDGLVLDKGAMKDLLLRAVRGATSNLTLPMKPVPAPAPADNAIVVRLRDFKLDVYRHTSALRHFDVGVGALSFPTPPGAYYIRSKAKNPTWRNPGSSWARSMPSYLPPGPRNPLGTRALRLDRGALVIHGTPAPWTIGRRSSHGCVRMRKADVEELYDLVPVGTPVFIVP